MNVKNTWKRVKSMVSRVSIVSNRNGAAGSYLGAMSLDFVARSFPASQATLDPLARILGEPAPGPVTRILISEWEGLFFGFGLALGMTRRPH